MKIHIIAIILFLGLVLSCNKNNQHPVPNVPFDITIDLNLPSYFNLQGVGGYAYVIGGSKGVVVYRRSIDEFVAFDRHSPADVNGTCDPLYADEDNFLQLLDPCSDAKFSMYDGSPISGSQFGLRQYTTIYNGSNLLRIYN
jgi:hypothetical protein